MTKSQNCLPSMRIKQMKKSIRGWAVDIFIEFDCSEKYNYSALCFDSHLHSSECMGIVSEISSCCVGISLTSSHSLCLAEKHSIHHSSEDSVNTIIRLWKTSKTNEGENWKQKTSKHLKIVKSIRFRVRREPRKIKLLNDTMNRVCVRMCEVNECVNE